MVARLQAADADTDDLGAAGLPEDDVVLTLKELEAEVGALDADEVPAPAEPVVQRVRKRKAPQRYSPSDWKAAKKITKPKTKVVKGGSTGGAPAIRPATAITWTAFLAARRKGTVHAGCVYSDAAGEYVIPFKFANFATRTDRQLLELSLGAISKHMLKYGRRAWNVKKVVVGRTRAAHLAKVTEGTGETAATSYVLNHYPGFVLVHGFGPGRGIDQIWLKAGTPAHYLLVEAKGPSASLSGDEMTLAWVQTKAHEMRNDTHGQAIGRAVGPPVRHAGGTTPRVTGIILRASWTSAGNLTAKKLAVPGGGLEKRYN